MEGDGNDFKRKEPAEASEPRLLSGNTNSTEQAESSNAQSNNEAVSSLGTPNEQNQVNPGLGFAMLAGDSNPWRNIRPRTAQNNFAESSGSAGQNSNPVPHPGVFPPDVNPWARGPLPWQQNGGSSSFFSMLQSFAPEVHNYFMGLNGLPLHGEGVEAERGLNLPEWEEEPQMHDDLRLDIDEMSYEELLALEEQIGIVNTGLTEGAINGRMRHYFYSQPNRSGPQVEEARCCICLEAFHDGELVGKLDCGHEYHYHCIKEWLLKKNICPICKSTGLSG